MRRGWDTFFARSGIGVDGDYRLSRRERRLSERWPLSGLGIESRVFDNPV